jgi:hypothetical protein
MLNGACCFYQMQEEEERRKQQEAAIQRTIRAELDLQRHQEMTQRHEQTIISHYQSQRRRKLMTQKQEVIAASMRDTCVTELASSQNRIPPPPATHTLHDPDFVPLHISSPNAENGHTSSKTNCAKPEAGVKTPSSTPPPPSSSSYSDGRSKQYYNRGKEWASMSKQRSELSSLLDSDEEDNGNDLDVEELEEIMIE